jgi:ABC-2 type transport system permease protein
MASHIERRKFLATLGGAAAWPIAARAQQPAKLPTIGLLVPGTPASHGQWFAVLVQRLRELGWIEGVRAAFNPNLKTAWFSAMTQVINQITLLTVILTGAALIREREQGTVEHLLVMPVVPAEIMLAKMLANGLVILVAAMLSLQFVVHWWIGAPIAGSLFLFLLGAALYAVVVAALGILLGTLATTMGQFGLLAMPILAATQLLSGGSTPMESMPVWLQYVMRTISPTPHFVTFAQAVLFRGADLTLVWRPLLAMLIIGSVYFAIAMSRFRRVIFGS